MIKYPFPEHMAQFVGTKIGTVAGFTFHEDKYHGDEVTLWAMKDGVVYNTEFMELPSAEEVVSALAYSF